MPSTITLAGITLWPGLILSPRIDGAEGPVSITPVQTAGRVVVQRHAFTNGRRIFLSCSRDGGKLIGGMFTFAQLAALQDVLNVGVAVPFKYRELPVKQVLIVAVPENPVKQTVNPDQAPTQHYAAWYTGQIQMIEV